MAAVDVSREGTGQPASFAAEVTPHDSNELGFVTRALYVGGAGTVTVTMYGSGSNVAFEVVAGAILPIRVTKVLSTGTDATLIVALW